MKWKPGVFFEIEFANMYEISQVHAHLLFNLVINRGQLVLLPWLKIETLQSFLFSANLSICLFKPFTEEFGRYIRKGCFFRNVLDWSFWSFWQLSKNFLSTSDANYFY